LKKLKAGGSRCATGPEPLLPLRESGKNSTLGYNKSQYIALPQPVAGQTSQVATLIPSP